ncbi:hypothetical protein PCAR4_570003 [Paraburkholderia caribensis]|nr:hypothetical protein PCAR4_570003 [Paraburkholderia caribensis]
MDGSPVPVSGGCLEDDLIDSLRRDGFPGGKPAFLRYGLNADEAHRLGLPCGGSLELIRESLAEHSGILPLVQHLKRGQLVRRIVDVNTGAVVLYANC